MFGRAFNILSENLKMLSFPLVSHFDKTDTARFFKISKCHKNGFTCKRRATPSMSKRQIYVAEHDSMIKRTSV